jgi:nucleoside-diphosphate-sugar epimerase
VGSAVAAALRERGAEAMTMHAPRLLSMGSASWCGMPPDSVVAAWASQLRGPQVVVNAAGDPDASSRDMDALEAANSWLPLVLALGSERAGCSRYIHVSTAAVQGRRPVLDDSPEMAPFSPYSKSKAAGEARLRAAGGRGVVVYRPPSVHAVDRRVTQMTARIARSSVSSVISPGDGPSPQALIENVGAALAHLALTPSTPPSVVIHPWEGITTGGLLLALGGRRPHQVPRTLGRSCLALMQLMGKLSPHIAADVRRVEMLWSGQAQAQSWLSQDGWSPVAGVEAWQELGRRMWGRPQERH